MKYKVKLRVVQEVETEIDAETEQEAIDGAYYLFDRGRIEFPEYFNYENLTITAEKI